jgi:hypothetical protein
MRRIIFFILFGMNLLTVHSQTEWKFIVGKDNTPVNLSRHENIPYNVWLSRDIWLSRYKSVQNQGYVNVGGSFGGERIRFEVGLGLAYYEVILKSQIDSGYRINGVGDYIFEKKVDLEYQVSNVIFPNLRLSSNFAIGEKNTFKLMVFNQSLSAWSAGACLERRFGGKFLLSALVYLPVSSLEPSYHLPESNIGAGMQLSYVFARKEKLKKEKLKKEKTNSSPTVL